MSAETRYRLCPMCDRSVEIGSNERFCVKDGTRMLEACRRCDAPIQVQGAKFCAACGGEYKAALIRSPIETASAQDPSVAPLTPAPNTSWTATRRGRASAILAILTIVGVIVVMGFNRQTQPEGSFVGQIAGTPLLVGLTVRAGQVFAYICDGREIGIWFRGTVAVGGQMNLKTTSGAQLTAQIGAAGATGRLELTRSSQYELALAPTTGSAGLYRATRRDATSNVVAGWVLLASSAQQGVVIIDAKPSPAPRLDPSKTTIQIAGVGLLDVRLADPRASAN